MDWQGMTLTQARPTGNTRSWATNCISLFQQTWGRRGGDKPSLRHQWPRKDNASGRTDSCLEWGSTKGCREPKHEAWIQALMDHQSWPPQTALRDRANLLPLHSTLWETGYSWLNIETHQRHWILNRNWDHNFRKTCWCGSSGEPCVLVMEEVLSRGNGIFRWAWDWPRIDLSSTSGDGGLFSPEPTEHFITVVSIEIGRWYIYIYIHTLQVKSAQAPNLSTERSRCAYLPPLTCLCQK